MHKIYHGLGPEHMKDLVKNSDCMYITRNTKWVELPVCRTVRYGYNSFLIRWCFSLEWFVLHN